MKTWFVKNASGSSLELENRLNLIECEGGTIHSILQYECRNEVRGTLFLNDAWRVVYFKETEQTEE